MTAEGTPDKSPQPHLTWEQVFLKTWRPYAWIILIGFLLYLQTLFFDFTYFDDNLFIINRYSFLSNLSNIFEAFKQDVSYFMLSTYYRPLLTISFMIDAQFGGISPFVYHFSNITIHILACCLLFILLAKLKYNKGISLLFTILFTIHPVLTQAVCWIPGRNDSLLAIFILPSFIFFIDYVETKSWKYYALHMLFFALALFTKELAFIIVAMAVLYLHLIIKEKIFSYNKIILGIGWLIVILCWIAARQSALSYAVKMTTFDVINSMVKDLPAIFIFIGKALFPFDLSVVPILEDSTINIILGCVTIILLFIIILLTRNKRLNFILFGALWFVFFLIPSFITSNLSVVSFFVEHRIYLSMMGFIIVLLETDLIKKMDIKKATAVAFTALVIIIFSAITFTHSQSFADQYVFWDNAVKSSPHSPLAHINLGFNYYSKGELDKSEKECRIALQLEPSQPVAHNNLGLIYMNKNMYKEAEEEFKQELAINRASDKALFNLGMLYYKQNKFNEAEAFWRKDLALNPREPSVHNSLGLLYMDKDMFKEAEEEFKLELESNPASTKALFNLGVLYFEHGRLGEAEVLWRRVLEINPREPAIHNNFGLFYVKKNMYQEAEVEFKKELALNPASKKALSNLALLYQKQGRLKEVEELWLKTIETNPNNLEAYKNLILFYRQQKDFAKAKYYIDELQKRGVQIPPEILKNMETR